MKYTTQGGREFVLAYHTPAAWGAETAARLRALGCSDEYAAQAEAEYASAVRAH